ncbi:hypothetical protein K443DRAFT_4953 [Laccaria amethystina LaAM-08-1]|uniref:Uncharacterized protein n=1 Tax=Laccaria amethystina LaAM-08-1 TaxID=1095629 RepID=A0A0C9XGE3_9AGAR|nr:hypothetical protein K443DRAFT_4953 [Laccaria amethystina LaAM-08-1]
MDVNGSCPGAWPKPPQFPLRKRMTVQPPHDDLEANARRLRRSVTIQPPSPHGDMDARPPRLPPWCTAETAPASPLKTLPTLNGYRPGSSVSVLSQLPRSKPPLAKWTPPLPCEINYPPRQSRQSRCVSPAPHPPRARLHLHTTPDIHREETT